MEHAYPSLPPSPPLQIYAGYGDKPQPGRIIDFGIEYLDRNFPQLSYIDNLRYTDGECTALGKTCVPGEKAGQSHTF